MALEALSDGVPDSITAPDAARAILMEALMLGARIVQDFRFECPECGRYSAPGNPCIDMVDPLGEGAVVQYEYAGRQIVEQVVAACVECSWAGMPPAWALVVQRLGGGSVNRYWTQFNRSY